MGDQKSSILKSLILFKQNYRYLCHVREEGCANFMSSFSSDPLSVNNPRGST